MHARIISVFSQCSRFSFSVGSLIQSCVSGAKAVSNPISSRTFCVSTNSFAKCILPAMNIFTMVNWGRRVI